MLVLPRILLDYSSGWFSPGILLYFFFQEILLVDSKFLPVIPLEFFFTNSKFFHKLFQTKLLEFLQSFPHLNIPLQTSNDFWKFPDKNVQILLEVPPEVSPEIPLPSRDHSDLSSGFPVYPAILYEFFKKNIFISFFQWFRYPCFCANSYGNF